nr:Probable D,D-dipeptide transport system permease protein ddpB [Klebsiella pneumoniae]
MLIYREFPFSMPSFPTHLTRLLQGLFTLLLTLFGLLLVTFSLSALSPVDRVLQIVGDHASQSTYDRVRHQLGLDQPLPVQFWHYGQRPMAILASPAPPASRCSTTCWRSSRRPLSWRPWR